MGFGYAAASVIEEYVCAVLVDFAMKSRVADWEHQSKWIIQAWICVYVLCMFFSVVGNINSAVISLEHCENIFFINYNGPLLFKLKIILGKY